MPRIQRQTARIGPVSPQPTPEEFGAAEGRQLVRIGRESEALVQLGVQIYDGYQQQLARGRAADAEDQLRRFAEEQARNPDFEAREKAYLEKASEIRKQLSGGLSPGRQGDFHRLFDQARNRHAATVRAQAREDESTAATALVNETLRLKTIQAVNGGPFDQVVARLEGEGAIMDLARDFGVPDEVAAQQIRQFRQSISDAQFTHLLRTDPVRAFLDLSIPDQGLAAGRTEGERQTLLTKTVDEIQSQVIRDQYIERQQLAAQERERKEVARQVQLSFLADAQTPEGLSVDTINQLAGDVLDPEEKRGWIQWALNTGGRLQPKQTNPVVYQHLRDAAKAGEDITSVAYEAVRDGSLTMSDANALLRTGEDVRFGPADDYIDSLRIGELAQIPGVAQRAARAQYFYEQWKRENPDASMAEAFESASREVERADVFAAIAGQLTIAQTPPRFAPKNPDGTFDLRTGELETVRRWRDGEISDEEKNRELDLIENMRRAQEAQERRRRMKAAGDGR